MKKDNDKLNIKFLLHKDKEEKRKCLPANGKFGIATTHKANASQSQSSCVSPTEIKFTFEALKMI